MKRQTNALSRPLSIVLCLGALLIAQGAVAATTGVEAFGVLGEAAGDGTSISSTGLNGAILIAFPIPPAASDDPNALKATLKVAPDSAGGAFAGDYRSVAGLSCRIRCNDGVEPQFYAKLRIADQTRTWTRQNLATCADPQVWTVNSIPTEYSDAGWSRYQWGADMHLQWSNDVQNIESLELVLAPLGVEPQSYTIDNVVLQSAAEFTAGSIELSLLEAALKDRFGVTSIGDLTDEQKLESTLVAGMTDVSVILSLHDANHYATATFTVAVAGNGNGITISWVALEGKTYTILRSQDLTAPGGGFEAVAGASGIVANSVTGIGVMSHPDDAAKGAGPYFYKIVMTD